MVTILGRKGAGGRPARRLLDHPPRGKLGEEIGAFDVYVDEAVKTLLARFENVRARLGRHAGVVHQQIQPAEA